MAFFDMDLDQLRSYRPDVREPDDFEDFWRRTLDEASSIDLDVRVSDVDTPQRLVHVQDVTFAGYGGTDVRCWFTVPAGTKTALPTVVSFLGYSGGRGLPLAAPWVPAGYAHLIMDTRGQGWYTPSLFPDTHDEDVLAGDAGVPGLMTRGIGDRDRYYYRRAYVDALRAVQTAHSLELVDSSRVVVQGGSQGGGLSIAAAGLCGMTCVSLAGAMIDVPFLCHFERAIGLTDGFPYGELVTYLASRPHLAEQVLDVLSNFDGVTLGRYAQAPALFSVALMDQVCPPSTVYAAYNWWAANLEETPQTEMRVYPYNGHEGGREMQTWECLTWLADLTKRA